MIRRFLFPVSPSNRSLLVNLFNFFSAWAELLDYNIGLFSLNLFDWLLVFCDVGEV